MKAKFVFLIFSIQLLTYVGFSQEYPLSRFYTYKKTPFQIVCPGLPEIPREGGVVRYQRVFEIKGDQKSLHGIALKYIGESYKSAKSVIDINDSENGLIIVKGTYVNSYTRYFRKTQMVYQNAETYHNLKFEIKDNRIRITIDNLKISIDNSSTSDFEEFIEAYESKDGLNGTEEDFRFKANMGIPINLIHKDITTFLEGITNYFEKEVKEDW